MSYRCEHGKDSDVCVQCWEEKNLELKPTNYALAAQERDSLKLALESMTKDLAHCEVDLQSTRAENVKMREASNNIEMLISELEGIYIGLMMHPSDYHLNGCLISQESKEKMRSITDIINRYKALSTTPPTTDNKEDVK